LREKNFDRYSIILQDIRNPDYWEIRDEAGLAVNGTSHMILLVVRGGGGEVDHLPFGPEERRGVVSPGSALWQELADFPR
jgi:hypothetical protein